MILAFAHAALVVPDLDRAGAFYQQMFGFEVLSRERWRNDAQIDGAVGLKDSACRILMMKGHNCFLELFQFESPAQSAPDPRALRAHEPGWRHIAFYVDDCHRELQRLLALGGTVEGTPARTGEQAYAVYCRDPFGNLIELAEIPNDAEIPTRLPGVSALGTYGAAPRDAGS